MVGGSTRQPRTSDIRIVMDGDFEVEKVMQGKGGDSRETFSECF
jgi:hypothetical protein